MIFKINKNYNMLKGKGENSTLVLFFHIAKNVFLECWLFNIFVILVLIVIIAFLTLLDTNYQKVIIQLTTGISDIVFQIAIFIAPFIFTVIALFPSFSEKLRERLLRKSNNGLLRIQNMLNQFIYILFLALSLLLFATAFKIIYPLKSDILGFLKIDRLLIKGFYLTYLSLVLLLFSFMFTEMFRAVRTIYILIVADYWLDKPKEDDK